MIKYGIVKELKQPFEAVCARLPDILQKYGFGVITKFSLQEKFKEKLGVEFRKYTVFGACNPPNALKAVTAEENIGLLLPCNVLVQEKDGVTTAAVIRPTVTMQVVGNPGLQPVAAEVEEKLQKVIEEL